MGSLNLKRKEKKMPPVKKVKTTPKTIKVYNTEIIIGGIYELEARPSKDVPQPIKGTGTIKSTRPGVKHYDSVIFDENLRRWDTGFEVTSPCNKSIPAEAKEALVDVYVDHIQKPFEEYYNTSTAATNDDFWGGSDALEMKPYQIELYIGKSYNTNHPKDLFDLFCALKQGKICEAGERDASLQRTALYQVKNAEKTVSKKEEKLLNKAKAFETLITLLNVFDPENDDTLYTLLEWINFSTIRGAEKEAVKKVVLNAFENEKTGEDTINRFLAAYEDIKDPNIKQEMELFSIVSKLNIKGKLEYKRGQYFIEGTLLGNNLREVAKIALANPDKKQIILDEWDKIQK